MENVDEQIKISICSILNSAPEKTVNDIIHALKYAGLESLSDLQFVEEDDLILVLKPIQRRKLVKAWREQSVNDNNLSGMATASVFSDMSSSQNTSTATNPILILEPYMPFCANDNNLDGWATTSMSSDMSTPQNTSTITNPMLIPQPYMPLSIPPSKLLNNLPPQNCKWKRKKCFVLLQVYAKYKNELLSCPDADKLKVWGKIAHEMQQRCSLNCNELQCLNKIEELKHQYQALKNQTMISKKNAIYLNEAKNAFQAEENLEWNVHASPFIPSKCPEQNKTIVVPKNGISIQVKWNKKKVLMLLKAFEKYKAEFSHPGVEEQVVWKRVANEFRIMSDINYDEFQCCSKIDELRQEYENLKNKVVTDQVTAIYLDEARKCFENTENPTSINLQSCKKKIKKEYRLNLLQVYTKYKADFASADIEEEKVWEKIVTELREKYLYDCGISLCRCILFQIMSVYEDTKKKNRKTKPYFFKEAQKAFEDIENLDVPNYEVDKDEKIVGKYIPPHLRNMDNKQNGPLVFSKAIDKSYTIKVSNLSEDIRTSDLQELFAPFGTIAHLYAIKSESDESKRFAFIKFLKQQDAARAILAIDGIEFNGVTFKVEWAESSQIDGIPKTSEGSGS